MKNPNLSFIIVCSFLCCQIVTAQITSDISSAGNTESAPVANMGGKTRETNYLLLGGMAIHPSQTSGFVMLGAVKKVGGYFKFKTNLNLDETHVFEGLSTDSRYFNGEIQVGRYATTGGLLWRAFTPVLMYGGLGYGTRWVNWKTASGEPFRVTDISHKGVELEAGIMIKINKLVLSGGVSVISFDYMEANIGVGIMFWIPPSKIKATHLKAIHGGKI